MERRSFFKVIMGALAALAAPILPKTGFPIKEAKASLVGYSGPSLLPTGKHTGDLIWWDLFMDELRRQPPESWTHSICIVESLFDFERGTFVRGLSKRNHTDPGGRYFDVTVWPKTLVKKPEAMKSFVEDIANNLAIGWNK